MEKMIELKNVDISILLGAGDSHLKRLEKACSVTLFSRGNIVKINGKIGVEEVKNKMLDFNIQTGVHYFPNHLLSFY